MVDGDQTVVVAAHMAAVVESDQLIVAVTAVVNVASSKVVQVVAVGVANPMDMPEVVVVNGDQTYFYTSSH